MGEKRKQALEKFHRESIMNAAGELFEKKGIDGTTMDDIAKLADYSKSTIYVYFKSKEEIYNSILIKLEDTLAGEIADAMSGVRDFPESFLSVCKSIFSFKQRFPEYFEGISRRDDMKTEKTVRELPEIEEVISELIARGKSEKLIAKNADTRQLAIYMWSGICGIINGATGGEEDFEKKYGITKESYLSNAYKRFYISLLRG